ncbi:MAG: hypothetical protein NVSMB53_03880 [Gemmatimonadaceae bacterium]
MTIDKSGLEKETKDKMQETEGKFRGDLGKAIGHMSKHVKGQAEEARGMSNPTQANPHPVSGHRTPREIAKDEAGAIGRPDVDVIAKEVSGESSQPSPAARRAPHATTSKRPGKRG